MNHAAAVGSLERLGDLPAPVDRLIEVQPPASPPLRQVLTGHPLHRQEAHRLP